MKRFMNIYSILNLPVLHIGFQQIHNKHSDHPLAADLPSSCFWVKNFERRDIKNICLCIYIKQIDKDYPKIKLWYFEFKSSIGSLSMFWWTTEGYNFKTLFYALFDLIFSAYPKFKWYIRFCTRFTKKIYVNDRLSNHKAKGCS